jgi:hypothetical protein
VVPAHQASSSSGLVSPAELIALMESMEMLRQICASFVIIHAKHAEVRVQISVKSALMGI